MDLDEWPLLRMKPATSKLSNESLELNAWYYWLFNNIEKGYLYETNSNGTSYDLSDHANIINIILW